MTCYLRSVTKCGYKGGITFEENGDPEPVRVRQVEAQGREKQRVKEVEEFERLHEADNSVYLQKMKVEQRDKKQQYEDDRRRAAEAASQAQRDRDARAKEEAMMRAQKEQLTDKYGECFVWSRDVPPKDTLSRMELNASIEPKA